MRPQNELLRDRRSINLIALLLAASGLILASQGAAAEPAAGPGIRSLTLAATPLIVKRPAGEFSVLRAVIQGGALSNLTVDVAAPGWTQPVRKQCGSLPAGTNEIELEIPVPAAPAQVKLTAATSAGKADFGPFTIKPPRKWTVYLTQHTHTDIGYTRPQTEILPEHLRYIDFALDYCDLTDGYPADAQFRWTCETSWAVREYLKRRPPEQIERLKKRVREGRIEITGMLVNMSDIATESSLRASLEPVRDLKREFGVGVRTAMQNDVNGAGWCLVDYFADIGLKYLTMGINETRSILPFDKPTAFWWESPSGKRVLAYRSDHYMTANFWQINDGKVEKMRPGVVGYLKRLEERAYPFDQVGVQFSGYYTDNSPPSTVGCDVVKEWNATYAWPRLRLSTAAEFLGYVETEHAGKLEVFRVAWPDWWTDGFGSAARETAAARETESGMQVTQGLLAMASMLGAKMPPGTLDRIAEVEDDLIFYAEHTFGAAESISDPGAENSMVQWGEKGSYAWEAVKKANMLREEAFGLIQDFLPRADVPTIAVFNTLNWARTGLARVFIDHEILPRDLEFRIVDPEDGVPVLAQETGSRAEGTYWALWVKNVPPHGYKLLRIETAKAKREPPKPAPAGAPSLENASYQLKLDATKGAIASLVNKETGQEVVDAESPWLFGQCVYETMPDRDRVKRETLARTTIRNARVQPGANGPIWKSLIITGDMDGCATNGGFRADVRLFEPEPRVELHYAIRKLPVRGPEAVYVAFPFRAPEGKLSYEAQGGWVAPGQNQLPGSSSDWQTIQNVIAVQTDWGQMLHGSEQAPLVQLGDFNLGKWQRVTKVEKPRVYSWVMNNYWFTNFRAEQDGEFKWSYYLACSKDKSRAFATRFGWASRIPLACRVLPPGKARPDAPPATMSVLNLSVPNVLFVETRPLSGEQGVVVHLRELDGKETVIRAEDVSSYATIRQADEVNAIGEAIQEGINGLTLRPYETRFVRIRP